MFNFYKNFKVPDNFIPAIKKGYNKSLEKGSLIGSKVTGLVMRLTDGKQKKNISSNLIIIIYFLLKVQIIRWIRLN